MKKSLIVGSNKGYGVAISKALRGKDFYTIGLSRGDGVGSITDRTLPMTDVSNISLFSEEFNKAIKQNTDIDTIIFVAGDVVLKKSDTYTEKDFKYTLDVNIGYIVEAVKRLQGKAQIKNIVTFGSQWSYLENNKVLASYCVAKHLLKRFTLLLNEKGIHSFHFCVPTSKTEKALLIGNYLDSENQSLPMDQTKWAEPDQITELIIGKMLDNISQGRLYGFKHNEKNWSLISLNPEMDSIDTKIQKLTLEDFFNYQVLYKTSKDLYTDLSKLEFN